MTQQPQWIVTTSSQRPVGDIADELKAAGLSVEQVLEEIGSITGRCSASVAARLRSIPGVADVSPNADIDIGPPGSGQTW